MHKLIQAFVIKARCPLVAALPLCLALMLSACGFQLRGAYQLPEVMQSTFIQAESIRADFLSALKRRLRASGIQISASRTEATAQLVLLHEKRARRTVSVDSRGRAREYTLSYELSFQLISDSLTSTEQTLRLERDFLFDPEDVLGNSRGEDQLYEEMRQDMLRLLLLKLQSLDKSTQQDKAVAEPKAGEPSR